MSQSMYRRTNTNILIDIKFEKEKRCDELMKITEFTV